MKKKAEEIYFENSLTLFLSWPKNYYNLINLGVKFYFIRILVMVTYFIDSVVLLLASF